MPIINIEKSEELQKLLSETNSFVVIFFWAEWAKQCEQMKDVYVELSQNPAHGHVKLCLVQPENIPEIAHKYNINAVPSFVFLKNNEIFDRLDGAHVPKLVEKLSNLSSTYIDVTAPAMLAKQDLTERLKSLISSAPVMLFMKGSVESPRCGFSRKISSLLSENGVKFSTFDILSDEEVRQGLKKFSEWPTYPQLYIQGELIGGIDIVEEMIKNNELKAAIPAAALSPNYASIVKKSPIMLFIKGSPDEPRCGFSKSIVSILKEHGIKFDSFDILQNEEVRQGLKKYSNWPTYPQLYCNGELIGGIDIVKDLVESGELKSALACD